jgi:hypothetical protein
MATFKQKDFKYPNFTPQGARKIRTNQIQSYQVDENSKS